MKYETEDGSCYIKQKCTRTMYERRTTQRTLSVGGSITVRLVSSFTSMDSAASLHGNNHIFSFLVKSKLFKLETICTVIFPLRRMFSGLTKPVSSLVD